MSAYPPASLAEDPTVVQAILNEEIEHSSWFTEECPSGHFVRPIIHPPNVDEGL